MTGLFIKILIMQKASPNNKKNGGDMKKLVSLTVLLFIMNYILIAQVAVAPALGDGTEENPYQIATLENLYWIAADNDVVPEPDYTSRMSSHYIQTDNIDATETQNWHSGTGWSWIGTSLSNSFSGSYNGQNHTIDAIFINRGYAYYIGLFGHIDGAMIENLGVTNVNITGNRWVGGLVGFAINQSTITNCYCTGQVSGVEEIVGGLVGLLKQSTVINCYSMGIVSGEWGVGGLVGRLLGSTLINSYSLMNVEGQYGLGGIVGCQSENAIITNSYYNYENVMINNEYVITPGALDNETYNTWLNSELYLNIDDYLSNEDNKYLINSVNDFKMLLAFGQFEDYSYKLTSNLDLEEYPNLYIPYFVGSFDGNSQIIDNLSLNLGSYHCIGLFGYINGATLEDITVRNVSILGNNNVGGLVGWQNNSSIFNSYCIGSINGINCVGGLVGWQNNNSIISNCCNIGNVNGYGFVGGLVGMLENNSDIYNCYNKGSVIGSDFIGGLVAIMVESTIHSCYSTGNVIGTGMCIGGFVGDYNEESTISNSYWNIETSGQETSVGGEGRTTAEMTFPYAENTYVDWDFNEIWAADEEYEVNSGYPYLREETNSIEEDNLIIPSASLSLSNYPNPFNPTTTIQFNSELFEPNEQNTLEIYNIKGQKIRQFKTENEKNKMNEVFWNGEDSCGKPVSSGVYLYRVEGKNARATSKMMLLK
jgi:hypothetical protein